MLLLIRPPAKKKIESYDIGTRPHIGLAYIGSYLRSKGIEVRILDGKSENLTASFILSEVKKTNPMLIGLTAMTHEIDYTAEIAEKIKTQNPLVKLVIGGVHATLLPKETLSQYPIFDFLVFGEGEITIHELICALEDNLPLAGVKGLLYKQDGEIIHNDPRELISNLDELPFPDWSMFKKRHTYPILAARGCPFQCIFCNRILGNKIRNRSINNILNEIERDIEEFGNKRVIFIDETFTVSFKRAHQFLEEFIKRNFDKKITWAIQTRVDRVNLDLLVKIKKAGCDSIDFGVESGNNEILKIIKKNITREQAIKAVMMAKKVGLKVNTFFIIGHPYETRKTIMDTIKLAIKLNSDKVAFGIMTPYPKTEVYNIAISGKGGYKLISKNWSDFNKNLGNALELEHISRRMLEFYQLMGFFLFYLLNFRIKDIFRLIKEHKNHFITLLRKLVRLKY